MRKYRYLSMRDRKYIEKAYARGNRPMDIAAKLGVHTATIYKELQRGQNGKLDANARPAYCAEVAQAAVQAGFERRGRRKRA